MGLDPASPIAPARVRSLILPVGKIKKSRFSSFVERLLPENVVRLGDISPDGRPNRNMFSPLGFAEGRIVFDLSTSLPPSSHLALAPFEQFREPLSIIAIADGQELLHRAEPFDRVNGSGRPISFQRPIRELDQELESLRDSYPKALVHHLLIFDWISLPDNKLPEGLFGIPPLESCNITTIKTIMCDISSMLLAEMTTLARSLQGRHTLDSPNQNRSNSEGSSFHSGDASYRRNSVFGNLEPVDTNGTIDKRANRMTMPASLTRRTSASTTSRPSTPVRAEDFANQKSPERPDLDRSTSTNRGRISVQGFGSSISSDMARDKAKARIAVVVGSLYLQAGRWNESIKELAEAATSAKTSGDHLWHAKALELIVVNMLMLSWAKLDFLIPPICFAGMEKVNGKISVGDAANQMSRRGSPSALATLLPELLARVLHLYERSSNRAGESLPQLAYSQSAIRFSKILGLLCTSDEGLSESVLNSIVSDIPLRSPMSRISTRIPFSSSRASVMTMVSRALPPAGAGDELSLTDRAIVYAGVASILGELGYYRKKALIIRDLISAVIPGLIQARIVGAAELGIHPSAGGAALISANGTAFGQDGSGVGSGSTNLGVGKLLKYLNTIYGALGFDNFALGTESQASEDHDTDAAILSRILRNARERVFGSRHMKMSILRTSIDLLEALPDPQAVLRCTGDLLRTAGSGIAPGPRSLDASPSMSRDEQLRLMSTIHKHIASGRKLGLPELYAEYWDEFLLRGITLEAPATGKILVPHQASILGANGASEQKAAKNPFIHNPYAKRVDAPADRVLVAGESAVFKVNLQNPYDVDLEIDSVRLESSCADFESSIQRTVIGPYRTQILSVSGTPHNTGDLTITGCIIKVRGCRERRFPIFEAPWWPARHVKIKTIGINAVEDETVNKYRPEALVRTPLPELEPPKPVTFKAMVTKAQPDVVLKSTSLPQSAIMILEGERRQFTITLHNLSTTTPVDLVLFSFQDSTQSSLQAALNNKDATAIELHEYELILLKKQALQHVSTHSSMYISPHASKTFTFELLGKPGLTDGTIKVDYCNLDKPPSAVTDQFFTRQVVIPLTITVNSSIELSRTDILPLHGYVPEHLLPAWLPNTDEKTSSTQQHCLLSLDLRNSWPSPLEVVVRSTYHPHTPHTITESVLPGATTRILLVAPRIYLDNSWKAIPALDASRQRQFVVSTQNVPSIQAQRLTREAFWYREAILDGLEVSWHTKSENVVGVRHGVVDLRSMRLSKAMIDILKVEEVNINIQVVRSPVVSNDTTTPQIGEQAVQVDTFHTLHISFTNRTSRPIPRCMFRLHAAMHNQAPHSSSISNTLQVPSGLDLDRKLIFQGNTQFCVDGIEASGSLNVEMDFIALCRGEYAFSGLLEEIEVEHDLAMVGGKEMGGNTAAMAEEIGRRRWISRESFVITVCDDEDDDD